MRSVLFLSFFQTDPPTKVIKKVSIKARAEGGKNLDTENQQGRINYSVPRLFLLFLSSNEISG